MYLSLMILLPLVVSLLVFFASKSLSRILSLLVSVAMIAIDLYLINIQGEAPFRAVAPIMQNLLVLSASGISLTMLLLSSILSLIVILYSVDYSNRFYAGVLSLIALMNGVFLADGLLLFYVFWEAMLIPSIFLIGVWGDLRRIKALMNFFLYTFLSSIFMLVAVMVLTFNGVWLISELPKIAEIMSPAQLNIVLWAFLIAFMVKNPLFPFHAWLPNLYKSASPVSLILISGVMAKTGGFGMIVICTNLAPASYYSAMFVIALLSVISIVYAGLVAISQRDLKGLVAYASFSHMGLITLGVFSGSAIGISGAVLQMFTHGLAAAMLFILVDIIHNRMGVTTISELTGLIHKMPKYSTAMMFVAMAMIGLPGLGTFTSEFMVFAGAFLTDAPIGDTSVHMLWFVIPAILTIVISTVYMLGFVRDVLFKESTIKKYLADVSVVEAVAIIPLVLLLLLTGIFPSVVTDVYNNAILQIMQNITIK